MKQSPILFTIAASLLMGNFAFAGDYTLSVGAEYTRGNYGADIETSMQQLPVTLGYIDNNYAWSITVPYVRISGSEDVTFSSSGKSPMFSRTTTSNVKRTDSGPGDISLSGTYQLQAETKTRPWLAVTGKIKLGTADETKRLGTGENDYFVQLDVAKNAVHAFAGYKIVGDTSTVNFDNVLFGAVGVTIPVNRNWTSVVEFYTEQASVQGIDNIQEVNLSFSKSLKDKKKLNLYMIKGLTDSSHDWGAGVSLVYPL
jgi:hypothetical protein